jgi:hypothetical protein
LAAASQPRRVLVIGQLTHVAVGFAALTVALPSGVGS